jgi:hypothetical protein
VSFWQKGRRKPVGAPLPVTSCDSFAEAEALVVRHCKLAYNGQDYIWAHFAGTLEALEEVSRIMEGGSNA